MRVFLGCFILATASVAFPPNSQDLQKKYGAPVSGYFAVIPGVNLGVKYGSDHLVCQAVIEPPASLANKNRQAVLMSSAVVAEVIETVAPVAMRGKQINSITTRSGCNTSRQIDYENVTIARMTHECVPVSPDEEITAFLMFKRNACPKLKTLSH